MHSTKARDLHSKQYKKAQAEQVRPISFLFPLVPTHY